MPIFPSETHPNQEEEVGGTFKTAHEHEDSQFLTLKYREGATSETTFDGLLPQNLTEKEKDAYIKSRYYLRKSLHLLNPALFPDAHFSSENALVVERKHGELLRLDAMKPPEKRSVLNQIARASLKPTSLDMYGNNFIKSPEGMSYVDSVVNTHYFFLLNVIRLEKPTSTIQEMTDAEHHDFMFFLLTSYLDSNARNASEFDKPLNEINLKTDFEPDKKLLADLLARYQFHIDAFQPLNEVEIDNGLMRMIDADPDRFFKFVNSTQHFQDLKATLKKLFAFKRPLYYLKVK